MKKLGLIFGTLIATLSVSAQLKMTAGDTYVYRFESLQLTGSGILPPPEGMYILHFDGATVDSGDSLRMELFEGLAEGTPLTQKVMTPGGDLPSLHSETAWSDHEGSIRLTALSGTFTINAIDIVRRDYSPNFVDAYTLSFTPVPEPSTIALGVLGAAALLYRRRC